MKYEALKGALERYPTAFPRFILPDGDQIPAHAHVTEVGHVIRNFIECGGLTDSEESVVLQTHVGNDVDHRLRSDRFAKILSLGERVVPHTDLDVEVEYDCCVVAQYPISETRIAGDRLEIVLDRKATQCRARERQKAAAANTCCVTTAAPCC